MAAKAAAMRKTPAPEALVLCDEKGNPTHVDVKGTWRPLHLTKDGDDANPEVLELALASPLLRASEVKPEAMTFLWLDRVPRGKITIVAGRPGMAKSLFSTFLAAHVTQQGGAVIMSNPEDGVADVQMPRLIVAGADTRLVHFWPDMCQIPRDVPMLERLVRMQKVELVVIDPIALHLHGRDSREAIQSLIDMAERTGCAVLGIHHLNKRTTSTMHPQDAVGGASGSFLGAARFVYAFGPVAGTDPEVRMMAPVKANHGAGETSVEFYIDVVEFDLEDGEIEEVPRIVLQHHARKLGAGAVVSFAGRGYTDQGGDPKTRAAAMEFLGLLLMHGAMKVTELMDKAAEAGISQMTVRRAADDVPVTKKRIGFGPGSHMQWSLPDGHPALKMAAAQAKLAGSVGGDEESDADKLMAQLLSES